MSITNLNEGRIFVDQDSSISANVTEYILQLFPLISSEDANTAAGLYASTGLPPVNQSTLVQSESKKRYHYECLKLLTFTP
jgi:hypothetical protein